MPDLSIHVSSSWGPPPVREARGAPRRLRAALLCAALLCIPPLAALPATAQQVQVRFAPPLT